MKREERETTGIKSINKNIIALGWVSFFTDMASSMVTSILPLFIVYTLNEGVDKLGFVVATATFISYTFRILFGYISDRYQIVKPLVVIGYSLSAVTKPLLYWSHTWQSAAALRGLERMGKSIRSATKDVLITAYSNQKSGQTFGFHKMMDIAGELVGSLMVFGMLFYWGESESLFRTIFALTLIPGIVAVLIMIWGVQDTPYASHKSALSLHVDYGLLPILFCYFGFTFFIFNDAFFVIDAKEAGIATTYIPLLIVVLNLVQTLVSYPIGLQIDKLGVERILGIAFVMGIASELSLYFNATLLSFIFLALFTVASLNALRAYISQHAQNKGTIYGILYGGIALFGAVGAVVTGFLWQHYTAEGAILFSLAGMSLVLLGYLILIRKKSFSVL